MCVRYVRARARKFWKVANFVPDVDEGLDRRAQGYDRTFREQRPAFANMVADRRVAYLPERGGNEREETDERKEAVRQKRFGQLAWDLISANKRFDRYPQFRDITFPPLVSLNKDIGFFCLFSLQKLFHSISNYFWLRFKHSILFQRQNLQTDN